MGNFTAGGTGKTPLTVEVVRLLRDLGHSPAILTRGYGGSERGPKLVEAADSALRVGDEALLLAQAANTWVGRDRAASAKAIEAHKQATVIVMDDGLQNPALAKSLTIAVVDAARGIGNGCVIPAGPLRAPLAFQLQLADAIVFNGAGGDPIRDLDSFTGPRLRAMAIPAIDTAWLRTKPIVAFAGIGNPSRFFDLLRSHGGHMIKTVAFADHKPLTENDAMRLLSLAEKSGAELVTTEKDRVRMCGTDQGPAHSRLQSIIRTVPIRLTFADGDEQRLRGLLARALQAPRLPT